MKKLQIVFDKEKVEAEGRYDYERLIKAVDNILVEFSGLKKGEDGFYLEAGNDDDWPKFWGCIFHLVDREWFLDNVKTFVWYNSDGHKDPEDFDIEDLKVNAHYLKMTD